MLFLPSTHRFHQFCQCLKHFWNFVCVCVCVCVCVYVCVCMHAQSFKDQPNFILFKSLALVTWSLSTSPSSSPSSLPTLPTVFQGHVPSFSLCCTWNSFLLGAFTIAVPLVSDAYPSDLPFQGGLLLVIQVLLKYHILREALSDHPTKEPSNNVLCHHPALIPSIATTWVKVAYPQYLERCLSHSRCSKDVCRVHWRVWLTQISVPEVQKTSNINVRG